MKVPFLKEVPLKNKSFKIAFDFERIPHLCPVSSEYGKLFRLVQKWTKPRESDAFFIS